MPHLESTRIYLRPVELSEAEDIRQAVAESMSTVGKWMSWAHSGYSLEDAKTWISTCEQERSACQSHEFGIFRRADDRFLGVAGFNQFNALNKFCNLGYWVRESEQRQRYVHEAITLLVPHALNELGVNRIEIVVALGNEPSAAAAKKAGATYEGIAKKRLILKGHPTDAHMFSFTVA
jgi:RimJ/RimL family protein N-acetyltransferase